MSDARSADGPTTTEAPAEAAAPVAPEEPPSEKAVAPAPTPTTQPAEPSQRARAADKTAQAATSASDNGSAAARTAAAKSVEKPAAGASSRAAKPAAGGAATFFLCNSWLVATAVALSRGRSVVQTWRQDFLWAGPACFVAAGAATFAASAMSTQEVWLVLFAARYALSPFLSKKIILDSLTLYRPDITLDRKPGRA